MDTFRPGDIFPTVAILRHIFGDVRLLETRVWHASVDVCIFGARTAGDDFYPKHVLVNIERIHTEGSEKAGLNAVHQMIAHNAIPSYAPKPIFSGCANLAPTMQLDYTVSELRHSLNCVTLDSIWSTLHAKERKDIVDRVGQIVERLQDITLHDPQVQATLSTSKFEGLQYSESSVMGGPSRDYFPSLADWLTHYVRERLPKSAPRPKIHVSHGEITIKGTDTSTPHITISLHEVRHLEAHCAFTLPDLQPSNILVAVRNYTDERGRPKREISLRSLLTLSGCEFLPFAISRALTDAQLGYPGAHGRAAKQNLEWYDLLKDRTLDLLSPEDPRRPQERAPIGRSNEQVMRAMAVVEEWWRQMNRWDGKIQVQKQWLDLNGLYRSSEARCGWVKQGPFGGM